MEQRSQRPDKLPGACHLCNRHLKIPVVGSFRIAFGPQIIGLGTALWFSGRLECEKLFMKTGNEMIVWGVD